MLRQYLCWCYPTFIIVSRAFHLSHQQESVTLIYRAWLNAQVKAA
jgi:hypothetical protein